MSEKKEVNISTRRHRARSELIHSSTPGSIRDNFRSNFFSRLKTNRSKSVDRFRQIVENYGELITYRSISDLRRVLETDAEASNLMRETEVNQLLNEIEHELAQVDLQDEVDHHVIQTQLETEDIVQRHLLICKICQNICSEGDICHRCDVQLQNEFLQ